MRSRESRCDFDPARTSIDVTYLCRWAEICETCVFGSVKGFTNWKRPVAPQSGAHIHQPFHALLHRGDLHSKLAERRPGDVIEHVDMRHEQLVWSASSIVSGFVGNWSRLPYVGRSHSGIISYVSGEGDIIQRMRYQNTCMYAKQVKSFPVVSSDQLRAREFADHAAGR